MPHTWDPAVTDRTTMRPVLFQLLGLYRTPSPALRPPSADTP